MTQTLKTLGQSAPAAATLTTIYTVPAPKQASCSSITICNRSLTPTSFRISIAVAGAADAVQQYLYFDTPIDGNDTFIATIGVSIGPTDVVRVYATLGTLSFNLFGVEVTP